MTSPRPVVLITGSANGIGLATAHKFFAEGFDVVLSDLIEDEVRQAARSLDSKGVRAIGLQIDVASSSSVNKGVAAAIDHFGRLDVLVNNAGNFRQGSSSNYSDDDWDFITSVHLDGAFRCARAAYPHLKGSSQGAIVSISSIAARIGLPQRLSYSVAKAGIEGLTRVLAVEWAKDGIRVNAVAPGFTKGRNLDDLEKKGLTTAAKLLDAIPLGRFAETSEQAEVIYFLGTPHSSFITGQVITVDGGTTIDIRI